MREEKLGSQSHHPVKGLNDSNCPLYIDALCKPQKPISEITPSDKYSPNTGGEKKEIIEHLLIFRVSMKISCCHERQANLTCICPWMLGSHQLSSLWLEMLARFKALHLALVWKRLRMPILIKVSTVPLQLFILPRELYLKRLKNLSLLPVNTADDTENLQKWLTKLLMSFNLLHSPLHP